MPLLFVHGAWHGAWCWDEHFLDFFADQGYACYTPSLSGHGASPGRERLRWTGIQEYVRDVAEAATRLPTQPVLIGHSMGGFVIQKYLEHHTAAGAIPSNPFHLPAYCGRPCASHATTLCNSSKVNVSLRLGLAIY